MEEEEGREGGRGKRAEWRGCGMERERAGRPWRWVTSCRPGEESVHCKLKYKKPHSWYNLY
eukprot:3289052-Rhodomonas_salina.1